MQSSSDANRDDVKRVIERDFPDEIAAVESLLAPINCPLIGRERLHLAHLKNAGGSLDNLRDSLAIADSRDVVCLAEYPNARKIRHSVKENMSPSEKKALSAKDRVQYESWLYADS